jgi:ubiquinone/menaquinone biosynthesis C-methylase UbiE
MTIEQYYTAEQYNERIGPGFRSKLFRQIHLLMEKYNFGIVDKILEIGGGSIPHINFIKHKFNSYYSLEVDCGAKIDLYINKNYPKIIFNYYDGKNIKFNEGFFDRIIISHCLEHILEPEKFINEMLRVLKKGGVISITLPCDPGILWRIGRLLIKIKAKIFSHKNIEISDYENAIEHVNSIFNLCAILKKKFNIQKEIFYPLNIQSLDLNLFYILQIRK